jgi:signal transduction histidine kinase
MNRVFNSLQVRFYALAVLLILIIIGSLLITAQVLRNSEGEIHRLDEAALQRANAYLLASIARRLTGEEEVGTRESIAELLRATMENTAEILEHLEEDLEENRTFLSADRSALFATLDELEEQWVIYEDLLNNFLDAEPLQQFAQLPEIDTQSVVFYTYAERLVVAFEAASTIERQNVQRLILIFSAVAQIAVFAFVVMVALTVRSINRLRDSSQRFADGELSTRAETNTTNEIAQVGMSFNYMADQITTRIQEVEEARDQAQRSDQVKSAFLASMSHELRTPLNSIINFSKFVARGVMGEVNEKQADALNKVVGSGQHLLSLINDVLDMSKIESGSLSLYVENNIDLTELIKIALANVEVLLQDKDITLESDIASNLPLLTGDRKRILQVVLNLLSNACKFTDEGTVKISSQVKGNSVEIKVSDTGTGIAKEDFEAVFQPFQQTDTGIRQGGGTGLGMPITKNLVEVHGGKIWFESVLGTGTTFYVSLPIESKLTVTDSKRQMETMA